MEGKSCQAPIGLPPATPRERASWRKDFEERGREAVRMGVYGYGPETYDGDRRDAAKEWLRTKELADERRAAKTYHYLKWMLDAAVAAAMRRVGDDIRERMAPLVRLRRETRL